MRIEIGDHGVGQQFQFVMTLVVIPMLKRAETDETGRHAGDYRAAFHGFAADLLIRAGHAQGAGGRNSKCRHRLGTEKFADR